MAVLDSTVVIVDAETGNIGYNKVCSLNAAYLPAYAAGVCENGRIGTITHRHRSDATEALNRRGTSARSRHFDENLRLGEDVNMVLLLNEREVAELLSMKQAMTLVEQAFVLYAHCRVGIAPRLSLKLDGDAGSFRAMMASLPDIGSFGLKTLTGIPRKRQMGKTYFAILLFDSSSGALLAVIAGFLPAIDMTAEDILRRNPRFLTRAKSFDTFLSLGPFLVTLDEVGSAEELQIIRVSTRLNGEVKRSNILADMRHSLFELVAYHSRVFTLEPGDILLTGTPGVVVLSSGNMICCDIEGVGSVENPVLRLPRDPASHLQNGEK